MSVNETHDARVQSWWDITLTDSWRAVELDLNALQAILFTSGTTGKPKGVQLTYGNHFYSAAGSAYRIGTHTDDRWLCALPLYHVGGLAIILRAAIYGITVVLQNGFDLDAVNIARPSTFLIDQRGNVRWLFVSSHQMDRPTPQMLLDAVKEFR